MTLLRCAEIRRLRSVGLLLAIQSPADTRCHAANNSMATDRKHPRDHVRGVLGWLALPLSVASFAAAMLTVRHMALLHRRITASGSLG
jgi:hypothetical protein